MARASHKLNTKRDFSLTTLNDSQIVEVKFFSSFIYYQYNAHADESLTAAPVCSTAIISGCAPAAPSPYGRSDKDCVLINPAFLYIRITPRSAVRS